MTIFIKPRSSEPAAPRTCDHCRVRPGDVHIRSVAGAGPDAAEPERVADWWLCSACAAALPHADVHFFLGR